LQPFSIELELLREPEDLYCFSDDSACPLMICLLGEFSILNDGKPIVLHNSGKAESLLRKIALGTRQSALREVLIEALWPDSERELAAQSLNSLVYYLRKQFSDKINGASPILYANGGYRLNTEAGVFADVQCFTALADEGDRKARAGDTLASIACYRRAIRLYRGDLYAGSDLYAVIEREHIRARYLTLLARLADYYYRQQDDELCLRCAHRLLEYDPCREDAHRLVMVCHVHRGERVAALRQYRLCQDILRAEFDMDPEPSTTALFERIRLNPDTI
jgi:DNA-binding SARP family transcriptional activator